MCIVQQLAVPGPRCWCSWTGSVFAPPARHGWVFRDTPVYDAAAAERHWQTMRALFGATL